MLFFKRGFVRLGSVLHIFFWTIENLKRTQKNQKITKNLKKNKKTQKNLSNLLEKKTKKQETTK